MDPADQIGEIKHQKGCDHRLRQNKPSIHGYYPHISIGERWICQHLQMTACWLGLEQDRTIAVLFLVNIDIQCGNKNEWIGYHRWVIVEEDVCEVRNLRSWKNGQVRLYPKTNKAMSLESSVQRDGSWLFKMLQHSLIAGMHVRLLSRPAGNSALVRNDVEPGATRQHFSDGGSDQTFTYN